MAERAILCISSDEAAEDVLEAWSLAIAWAVDQDGVAHPSLQIGNDRSDKKKLRIKSKPKYTMGYVRKLSQAMMRELCSMLHRMPELPPVHWLSMRLAYREDVTPTEYEPEG